MAKRAPAGEEPFRPLLDKSLISAALTKAAPAEQVAPSPEPVPPKVIDIPRNDIPKRQEASRPPPQPPQPQKQEVPEDATPLAGQYIVEKFDQEKRMLLTRTESDALDRLVRSLARRLNTQVKLSHVLRSLVALILNAEREIDKRAGEAPSLSRPANGDAKALQNFEREIAKVLASAIRDAGNLR
jgi:hypothetical protein